MADSDPGHRDRKARATRARISPRNTGKLVRSLTLVFPCQCGLPGRVGQLTMSLYYYAADSDDRDEFELDSEP